MKRWTASVVATGYGPIRDLRQTAIDGGTKCIALLGLILVAQRCIPSSQRDRMPGNKLCQFHAHPRSLCRTVRKATGGYAIRQTHHSVISAEVMP